VTASQSTTRDRIVQASAELLSRQGYAGTGLKQIVTASNAPFGSVYHFFPGGKEDIGAAAIRWSGQGYLELIAAYFDDEPDVVTAVGNFFAGAAEVLRETDYADACPIATVALEVASTSETLRQATADVFESWIDDVTFRFEAAGMGRAKAREVTIAALAALEGAFVLSRATRSAEAVEIAGRIAIAAVRQALTSAD
jgi:AcrR family transcriptional regulator